MSRSSRVRYVHGVEDIHYQPLVYLVPASFCALLLGCLVIINILWNMLRIGPRRFFTSKARDIRPEILADPVLGTHHYAQLKNIRLHFVANGREDRQLLLFLHGFPEFWYSWRHQLKELSQEFRTVALDMRGYGESEKPPGVSEYHVDKLTNDVRDIIEYLGYKSCYLVGHDWGGAVAWVFAAKYPNMVTKLVCCNAPNPYAMQDYMRQTPSQMLRSWYMFMFQLPWLPELYLASRDFRPLNAAFRRVMTEKPELFTKEDLEAFKYTFKSFGDRQGPINYYRAAFRYKPLRLPSRMVKSPTMIIWGVKDRFLDKKMIEPSRQYVAGECVVRYIENASHWVQQQEPKAVNQYIREFLNEKH